MKVIRHPAVNSSTSLPSIIDSFFDDEPFFGNFLAPIRSTRTAAPAVNISETEKELRVTASVPGFAEKDLSVELDADALIIRGENSSSAEEKGENFHRREFSSAGFRREIALPKGLDLEQVKSSLADGVLSIALPKKEDGGRQKVKIESK